MVNKHEAKALYPSMMSLLELGIIISSSITETECGFSVMKLLCIPLTASMVPYTRYFNANLSVWRLTYQ